MWMWLTGSAVAGLCVRTHERAQFRTRTLAALHGDQSLMRGLLDSGRRVLAGMLLIVPGVITDVVAMVLLLLPINQRGAFDPQPVTRRSRPVPSRPPHARRRLPADRLGRLVPANAPGARPFAAAEASALHPVEQRRLVLAGAPVGPAHHHDRPR